MLRYLGLGLDLAWVALSAVLAVLIRDNFVPYDGHLEAVAYYAAMSVGLCAVAFLIVGVHKTPWQYISLPDFLRIVAAITISLLLAVFVSFLFSRLEGVARSVPAIQWLLLVVGLVGIRIAARTYHESSRREQRPTNQFARTEHVLIVGLSHLTELYLESVAEYGSNRIEVVGILSEQRELRGSKLRFQKVLGTPEDLPEVMAQLDVHGVTPDRIVVMQSVGELSSQARDALLAVERSSTIRVDWLVERLGLTEEPAVSDRHQTPPEMHSRPSAGVSREIDSLSVSPSSYLSTHSYLKRGFDILVSLLLLAFFAPLVLVLCGLVVFDVGLPLVFWQKRPGSLGKPFKLFKLRTMGAIHDVEGKRLSDAERSSYVGELLRRTKLDELPQLYNILIGEMSFVGPRPLLPADQPTKPSARLLVAPGLTGFAQVYGQGEMSPEDKNALDVWYISHASPWLDIKVLLRTLIVMVRGEQVNHQVLHVARTGLESSLLEQWEPAQSGQEPSGSGTEPRVSGRLVPLA